MQIAIAVRENAIPRRLHSKLPGRDAAENRQAVGVVSTTETGTGPGKTGRGCKRMVDR